MLCIGQQQQKGRTCIQTKAVNRGKLPVCLAHSTPPSQWAKCCAACARQLSVRVQKCASLPLALICFDLGLSGFSKLSSGADLTFVTHCDLLRKLCVCHQGQAASVFSAVASNTSASASSALPEKAAVVPTLRSFRTTLQSKRDGLSNRPFVSSVSVSAYVLIPSSDSR